MIVASIMTGIELQDHFSSVMYEITGAMNEATQAAGNLQSTMDESVTSSPYEDILDDVDKAAQEQEEFNQKLQRGNAHAGNLERVPICI